MSGVVLHWPEMLTAVLILGAGPVFHEVIGGNVWRGPRVGPMPRGR